MRERYDIVCLPIQACEGTMYYVWNQSEPVRTGGVAYWEQGKSGCGQLLYHRVQATAGVMGTKRTNILTSLNKIFAEDNFLASHIFRREYGINNCSIRKCIFNSEFRIEHGTKASIRRYTKKYGESVKENAAELERRQSLQPSSFHSLSDL